MIETLLRWDTSIFHWINHSWSNPLFDYFFPLIRNKYFWLPLYVLVVFWIMFNHHVRSVVLILFMLGLSIFAADTISSTLIKNNVQRVRPCHVLYMDPPVIERVACGSGYSFTSSHATNHFCIAAFFISVFGEYMRRWKYVWWLWAFLISLAQVYVGVHYPIDIIGGALLGTIIGASMGRICFRQMQKIMLPLNSEIK
ncbi:MAG: phosphatase PAP2 family protein [Saprospiraceae bacterium]